MIVLRTTAIAALVLLAWPSYAIVQVGSVDFDVSAWDLSVSGDLAFVAIRGGGLALVDVSEPASPVAVGSFATPAATTGLDWVGSTLFVITIDENSAGALHTYDVSFPETPVLLGSLSIAGRPLHVRVVASVAYVTGIDMPLATFDVSNPAAPTLLGTLGEPANLRGNEIYVRPGLAIVASNPLGVVFIDVSDPATPVLIGNLGRIVDGIHVEGDLVYFNDNRRFQIADFSTPESPVIVGVLARDVDGRGDVAVHNGLAVVRLRNGFVGIDVSDPQLPSLATQWG